MAIINTLRNKLGKVVVIAIAVSILSFVLADVLGPNSILLGGNNTTVGEIAGQEIEYEDYNQRLEIFRARYGNLGANQNAFIQSQAWDALISEIAFQPEFDALGLNVTEDELVDMVQGRHIDPALQQQFTDPQTGEFNVDNIVNYLKQLSQLPPEQRAMWESYERDIRQGRQRVKYDNLLGLSSYITSVEAKQYYQEQTEIAEIKYLYVPFYSVNDSSVQVTETALQSYLNNHEDEYQTEGTKTIQYVNFQIQPSATDSTNFHADFNELKEDFKGRTDDSTFARINSDAGIQFFNTYSIGQLPSLLQINAETLNEGEVYGPYYEAGKYKLYKISKEFEDTVYTAKVRHILIKWQDTSDEAKAEAKQKADDLLRQLRRGADFAELARENSEDAANAQRGGELGWGVEGSTWVPEFEEAVFERESAGLVNRVVETSFGYHLVDVTEPKTNKSLKIATIAQEITPSQETIDQVYRQADQFAYNSGNRDEFSANASEANLAIQTAENIDQNARNINNVQSAREVVRWMFNEASIGEVSSVFDLESNSYIVALLTGESDKGTASLENVRDEITIKVRNKLKADRIKEKLAGLSGSLDEIASAYGSDASINSSSDLKMSTSSLPSVGFAPAVVGTAFGLNDGQVSQPIAADNGIVVVQLMNKTGAPEIGDYTSYKTQMQSARQSRISYQVMEAIKEFADIEDNRIKYY